MRFNKLSDKQKKVFAWAHSPEYRRKYYAIICDGSIRSGKTVSMIAAFILWAMDNFDGQTFAICGKTIASTERNIIRPLTDTEDVKDFFNLRYTRSKGALIVEGLGKSNTFYIFGGKDEGSAALIQGVTLAGVLFDEVALMPRSFVEQAMARCSVEGATFWFNCNPEGPDHWFYTEWIKKAAARRALHLHFTMRDNPSLSDGKIEMYENMYDGVFYDRFIKGEWVKAEGLVYPMFDRRDALDEVPELPALAAPEYYISIDYGTINPTSMGLWRVWHGTAVRIKEDYYDSRNREDGDGIQLTDEEYYKRLERLAGGLKIESIIIDPSAASFITCIRRHGKYAVRKANNDVINGIRFTATLLKSGKIKILKSCKDCIREFGLYSWDEEAAEDKVIKANDHAMDEIRYFCYTILRHTAGFNDREKDERTGWI